MTLQTKDANGVATSLTTPQLTQLQTDLGLQSAAFQPSTAFALAARSVTQTIALTVADIISQAATALSTQTVTNINLVPGATYTVPAGTTITIDTAYVTISGNWAVVNAAWGAATGQVFLFTSTGKVHVYTKAANWKVAVKELMVVNDPSKLTSTTDDGPDLMVFDVASPGASDNSIRIIMDRVILVGGRRNVIFGSSAYFVKWHNCEFVRSYQCFDTTAAPVDFAEQNEFSECLFGENRVVWGPSAAGQIYNVKGGSIDYNRQICNITNGTRVHMSDKVHIEWSYGNNAGETNSPVTMNGAAGFFGGQCTLVYAGTNDPAYGTFAAQGNGTNEIRMDVILSRGMGAKNNRKSYNAFCSMTTGAVGTVNARFTSELKLASDAPEAIVVCETGGQYGNLRGGISNPFPFVGYLTGTSGTANAIVNVTAAENGVSLKPVSAAAGGAGQPMLKFQNGTPGTSAIYYICFPKPIGQKTSWSAFFNTFAISAGSAVIRQRRNGPARVFNGTSVSYVNPGEGASYQTNSVTLAKANSVDGTDWNRYGHADMTGTGNGSWVIQPRQETTDMDIIEVDVTGCTGPLYVSFIQTSVLGG